MRARSITRTMMFLAPALGILAPTPVMGQETQDDSLKELLALLNTDVTVASKSAESVNAAPGIITVVTRPEIEGFAAQNLGQVLNRVVGMQLLSPDIFVDQSVVIRGQEMTPYNNHVLVLLNGRPMRDPITGGLNGPYWNAFPLGMVEKLEIIRGPGSVLYGSCAYSGVVNIVTRSREDEGLGGQATVGGGSFGGFGQSANLAMRSGDLQLLVGLSQFTDKGPTYSFEDYNPTPGSGDFGRHTLGAVAHLSYKGLTFNAFHGNFDPKTLDGLGEAWPVRTKMQEITTHADFGYSAEINSMLSLGANLTYNKTSWYTGDWTSVPDPTLPGAALTDGQAVLFEGNARIKPMEGFNLVLGIGGEKSTWGGESKEPMTPGGLVTHGDQTSSFIYVQADYRIAMVKLIGGMQYNKIQDVKGNLSPRLGVIVDFTPELGAKVLYSTAFRKGYRQETNFNIVHPVDGPLFMGNPSLKPETVTTIEGQLFYQSKTAQASITYFHSKMEDIIGRTSNSPYVYLNGGNWSFDGVELEGRVSLTPRLLLTGSASYQTNKNEAEITDASLHPNSMVKAGLLYTGSNWTASLFNAWFGKPKSVTLVKSDTLVVNPEAEAANLLSAKLTWKVLEWGKQALKLSVEGQNLLDKDIRYPDYPNKKVNTLIPLSSGSSWMAGISILF